MPSMSWKLLRRRGLREQQEKKYNWNLYLNGRSYDPAALIKISLRERIEDG
jgi:hypothetical protein